jgi:predicted  nucleic acid-binding Zn-ribbon protein
MTRPQRCNLDQGQLLEQAQENISRIADLESQLEAQRKANLELRATLAESQKNEGKMKSEIRKMHRRNKSLEQGIQRSEVKYECEVLQFMLESEFRSEGNDGRMSGLKANLARLEREKVALNTFIQESQGGYRQEVEELRGKLKAAFEVTYGFRREVSKLKSQLESPATKLGSPQSSPSPKKRRRNSVEVAFSAFRDS